MFSHSQNNGKLMIEFDNEKGKQKRQMISDCCDRAIKRGKWKRLSLAKARCLLSFPVGFPLSECPSLWGGAVPFASVCLCLCLRA